MRYFKFLPIILLACCFASCGNRHSKQVNRQPLQLKVWEVVSKDIPMTYTFVSETESNYDFTVEPRVNGYLNTKNYKSGVPVNAGDLLFTIDSTIFSIEVAKAKASLASSIASLKKAQANYNRVIPLANIDAMSQSDVDAARAELASAKASVNVAKQVLTNANLQLSYTKIYSPKEGIPSSSSAVVGDYVGPGTSYQVLTTVSYIDTVSVLLSLPMSKYLKLVEKGRIFNIQSYDNANLMSDITMTLSDGSVYPYKGIYSYTKTFVDNNADVIKFYVVFPNPNYALKSGQFVRVTASLGQIIPEMLIPQRCVTQLQNTYMVWVVSVDGILSQRLVDIVDTYGDYYVVGKGLFEGDKVLYEGLQKARSGEKINPVLVNHQ